MTRYVKTFLGAPPRYRQTLFQALVMVAMVRIGLWVLPYRVVYRLLDGSAPQPVGLSTDAARAYRKRVTWAVNAVSRRLLGKKPCLVQALAARWLLARRGIAVDFRIGVTLDDSKSLLAHAWLEQNGVVIIGGADSPSTYRALKPVGS